MIKREVSINDNVSNRFLFGAFVLFALTILISLLSLSLTLESAYSMPYLFLLPWVYGLGVLLCIPTIILYKRGQFSLADPLIFATWTYFLPAFVLGGTVLSFGWSDAYFLAYIQDPVTDLPYSVVLIGLGFAGLTVGYFLPVGDQIGRFVSRRLPNFDLPLNSYIVPGLMLLGLGMVINVTAFVLGVAGYQSVSELNMYDVIVISLTHFWAEAMFLLWWVLFKRARLDTRAVVVGSILLVTFLARTVFAGNRGSLLYFFICVLVAYLLAGRAFTLRHAAWSGFALVLCLAIGVAYGSTFRSVKGSEETVGIGEYSDNILQTFDELGQNSSVEFLEFASVNLAARLDTLSSVAVVVSNYEALKPYEEQYGLEGNIFKDLSTFFVPRLLWPDKPVSSDARSYSELYFNYGQNAFAITPIGDLLRNFGPVGVPLGMLVLGMILRTIYASLILTGNVTAWKGAIYFVLLTSVSYEGFYGSIIPSLVKYGLVAVVGVLIIAAASVVIRVLGSK